MKLKATESQLHFLDTLRASEAIDMSGAAPYVGTWFNLSDKEARNVLAEWKETYTKRVSEGKTAIDPRLLPIFKEIREVVSDLNRHKVGEHVFTKLYKGERNH